MAISEAELLEIKPMRNLTFWHIWALGVGSVIGDGIFVMIGEGIAISGPSSIFAYFIAGLLQMFLMVGLGELAIGMPSAGSLSVWVGRFMGKWWGFFAGFLFAAGWLFAGGSVSIALGRITTWFFPQFPEVTGTITFAILFLTIFAVLNILGGLIAARVQFWLVIILAALMAGLSIFGLPKIDFSYFTPMFPHGARIFPYTVSLGVYAYVGSVTLTTAGDECKKPSDLPKGLVWAAITFLVLYTGAHIVAVGTVPMSEISLDVPPFTKAAEIIFGYAGGFLLNLAAWLAAATCIHMGTLYATSRILYSQSRSGYLPKFFGYLHPKTRTPIYGIIFIWVLSVILILLSLVNPDLIYVHLALQLVLAWLVSWLLAAIAAILYRVRCPEEVAKLEWKQPLFPLFPVLGIIGVGITLWGTLLGSPTSLIYAVIWMVGVYLLFRFYSMPRAKKLGLE